MTFQNEGVEVEINGEKRHLIWDYGVIEKVQDVYGGHPIMALDSIFWTGENGLNHYQAKPVLDLLTILLNNEIARQKYFEGSSSLKPYKREELGYIVDRANAGEIVKAIVESWTGSLPDAEDGEEDEKNLNPV